MAFMVAQAHAFELKVDIKNIRSDRGNIKLALYKGSRGFPSNSSMAYAQEILEINDLKAGATFRGLTEGEYAIAVFHDENNDNRLNTRFRIPREPFGFSNNPTIMGPPKYSKCKFTVRGDMNLNIFLKSIL